MEYAVKITETLVKTIKVNACDEIEAKKKVKEAYLNEKIVLDAEDYAYHDMELLEPSDYENDPSESEWEKIS